MRKRVELRGGWAKPTCEVNGYNGSWLNGLANGHIANGQVGVQAVASRCSGPAQRVGQAGTGAATREETGGNLLRGCAGGARRGPFKGLTRKHFGWIIAIAQRATAAGPRVCDPDEHPRGQPPAQISSQVVPNASERNLQRRRVCLAAGRTR